MPNYDMEAIHKAHPEVVRIECGGPDVGIWDEDGNAFTVDQAKVDAARVELDKLSYKKDRVLGIGTTAGYPNWQEQMDLLYHDIKNGTLNTSGQWYVGITSVKVNIPKPS
tara:strand:+ start:1122 stop:1451 length:330 start_codon:yes stop_codon:yes gene_type:complete